MKHKITDTVSGNEAWLWLPEESIEDTAKKQIQDMVKLPWVWHHIAIMPDCHWGNGATVGSVFAMKDAIIPSAVGVDIGCGMIATRIRVRADGDWRYMTSADLPDNLRAVRRAIERLVPVGFEQHKAPNEWAMQNYSSVFDEWEKLPDEVQGLKPKAQLQCGTLGGGNHFIELCLDEADNLWLMLHSGSRNIGKQLAEVYINKAQAMLSNADLPNKELAAFLKDDPYFWEYINSVKWAQKFAFSNREVMIHLITLALRSVFPRPIQLDTPAINCHHNYVEMENHFGEDVFVTRKGAIRAGRGDYGIIPGSMGTKSYIVTGLGNPDSFHSASHGAGRAMSRGAARRNITLSQFRKSVEGVECRIDEDVKDEAPDAYKPIEQVMAYQNDLVQIEHTLKQILCVKGGKDRKRKQKSAL